MLRVDRARLLLSLACTLGLACEGGSDADEDAGAGADELELWPIPNFGNSATPSPIGRPRDAGMDAASSRDAGRLARDASFDAHETAPSAPPDLSLQVFDPKQVYLWGSLSERGCDRDGVASVFDPNRVAVGFACQTSGGQVRPGDGRLLYLASTFGAGVRVFSCDGCQADAGVASYPSTPEANDELIPSMCGADAGPLYEWGFLTLPDGGVVQLCGTRWVDSQGRTVAAAKPTVLAFGHANTALLADGILDLRDAAVQPLTGLDAGEGFRAYRVREDGYWVVPRAQDAGTLELWQVAFDGSAGRVGAYPPLPTSQRSRLEAKLDHQGDLFELTSAITSSHDTIVRRSLDGGSDVIYDEATGPRLKIHNSSLVTGP